MKKNKRTIKETSDLSGMSEEKLKKLKILLERMSYILNENSDSVRRQMENNKEAMLKRKMILK